MRNISIFLIFIFLSLLVSPFAQAEMVGSISGKVIAEDTGKGIEGVGVTTTGKGCVMYDTETDANGVYVLKELKAGTYKLDFSKKNSQYLKESDIEVVLLPDKEVADANRVLMLSSFISGKVIAEDTGKGIAGVSVVTQREEDGRYGKHYSATTNEKGIYILNDLKAGTYLLAFSINNSPYISVKPHLKVFLPKGKNIDDTNYTLMLGGSVSGTIRTIGSNPSDKVIVLAKVSDAPKEWVDEHGDFDVISQGGKFLIQGLPESDNCIVKASSNGIHQLTRTVKIQKGKVTENIDFVFNWDNITGISGNIKSSTDNRPLMMFIGLLDMSENALAGAATDANGKYSIKGVPPGVYKVLAWSIFLPKEQWIWKNEVIVEQGKSTDVNFEFNLPATKTKTEK